MLDAETLSVSDICESDAALEFSEYSVCEREEESETKELCLQPEREVNIKHAQTAAQKIRLYIRRLLNLFYLL